MERNKRKVLTGTVISNKMDKAVVINVEELVLHKRFKKYYKINKKFYARDGKNECEIGDFIEIIETRPLSKKIRWRVSRILKKAVGEE
ncbi:30S ribosomal protein S17 [bacterium]|nr:30S ribosomal protein S17 [bacterium]